MFDSYFIILKFKSRPNRYVINSCFLSKFIMLDSDVLSLLFKSRSNVKSANNQIIQVLFFFFVVTGKEAALGPKKDQ